VTTNQAMPKVGDIIADKYEIEKVIGEGGMGAVFAATHKLTGKRVAMKWMLPELARDEDAVHRFMREAQAAGRINHPNVVDVYDVGKHDDSFFIVMEYLSGEPLTAALNRQNLSIGEVLDLMLPAMRGVAAAHRQGVVHRDLKPDNIFLAIEEGQPAVPKVLDFGISKVASSEGQVNPRLTKTGAVVGTPYYMCPEAIRGSNTVDKRADVYAFGVILYEAFTGKVPFDADTYSALILEIATGTARHVRELLPDFPPELGDIVMKAMAREVNERFQDLESLGAALEPFAATAGLRAERRDPTGSQKVKMLAHAATVTTPFASEAPAGVPRRKGGTGIAIAAAVLVLGGVAWFMTRGGPGPTADSQVVQPSAASTNPGVEAPGVAPAPEPTVVAPAQPSAAPVAVVAPAAEPVVAPEPPAAELPVAAEPPTERTRKRDRVSAQAPTAAATPSPPTAPKPSARPAASSARSGTISVDDF
jgi:eukaryotic-like serine/threonine-protein kinase